MTTPPDRPFAQPSTPAEPTPGTPQNYGLPIGHEATPPPPLPVVYQQPGPVYYHQSALPYQRPVTPTSGLYVAAAVLNWVVLGILVISTFGIGIIAAAWFIPMTVLTHKAAKDGYKHTGLAVCTLLFCGLIAGILMLVDEGNRQPKPLQ